MSIEAMQQALNALEYHTMQTRPIHHTDKAIEALRQAIEQAEKQFNPDWDQQAVLVERIRELEAQLYEQAEKQEPVAWMTNSEHEYSIEYKFNWLQTPLHDIPLYTAPPRKEWVELNLDDIPDVFVGDISFCQGAKWAQAKLKEKNT